MGTDHDVAEVVDYLTNRPYDAKAYGVTRMADGSIDPESVREFLPATVLVRVTSGEPDRFFLPNSRSLRYSERYQWRLGDSTESERP